MDIVKCWNCQKETYATMAVCPHCGAEDPGFSAVDENEREELTQARKELIEKFPEYDHNPEYQTVVINSQPITHKRNVWFGLLGKKDTGLAAFVDGQDIANKIYETCRLMHLTGYEVISVSPITSGVGAYNFPGGNYTGGAGWGYSFTSGAVITSRRIRR